LCPKPLSSSSFLEWLAAPSQKLSLADQTLKRLAYNLKEKPFLNELKRSILGRYC
jgi:hypothetical protein